MKHGKTAALLIADSGPDWNTASLVNAVLLMRLWRDCNLDMLVICSYAARFSAYNHIEHLWSPMSKLLTSVTLPANIPGEDKAPCQQKLPKETIKAKEVQVFDREISQVCEVHWKDATFDGSTSILKCLNNDI